MGIMVAGGIFKCFGTAQHIKNKYSTGFIIEMKVKQPDSEELGFLLDCIASLTKSGDIRSSESENLTKDKYFTIASAEQKIRAADLGDWVSKYTLIKLLKICHPKEEASLKEVLKFT